MPSADSSKCDLVSQPAKTKRKRKRKTQSPDCLTASKQDIVMLIAYNTIHSSTGSFPLACSQNQILAKISCTSHALELMSTHFEGRQIGGGNADPSKHHAGASDEGLVWLMSSHLSPAEEPRL